jgi:hypothetical protein
MTFQTSLMAHSAAQHRTDSNSRIAARDHTAKALSAKTLIRRNVLAAIGADQARVFDAFAGSGQMHARVWSQAAHYIGCDLEFYRDERPAFVADNRRVMRAIDLAPFNVFDLDAYGSPWEQVTILAARRKLAPSEVCGLVLTEGSGLKIKFGTAPLALAKLAGVQHHLPGMSSQQDMLIGRAISRVARLMGGTVAKRWEAHGKVGSSMRYIGLVLEGACTTQR